MQIQLYRMFVRLRIEDTGLPLLPLTSTDVVADIPSSGRLNTCLYWLLRIAPGLLLLDCKGGTTYSGEPGSNDLIMSHTVALGALNTKCGPKVWKTGAFLHERRNCDREDLFWHLQNILWQIVHSDTFAEVHLKCKLKAGLGHKQIYLHFELFAFCYNFDLSSRIVWVEFGQRKNPRSEDEI